MSLSGDMEEYVVSSRHPFLYVGCAHDVIFAGFLPSPLAEKRLFQITDQYKSGTFPSNPRPSVDHQPTSFSHKPKRSAFRNADQLIKDVSSHLPFIVAIRLPSQCQCRERKDFILHGVVFHVRWGYRSAGPPTHARSRCGSNREKPRMLFDLFRYLTSTSIK